MLCCSDLTREMRDMGYSPMLFDAALSEGFLQDKLKEAYNDLSPAAGRSGENLEERGQLIPQSFQDCRFAIEDTGGETL